MTRPTPTRRRLLLGASAAVVALSTMPADAQDMFRRTPRDPAAQAAQAAANRATQNQAAATATRRTIEAFQRAATLRQQMDAAQAAARAQAMQINTAIANGLRPGGLQVANGVETDPSLWTGANAPTQSEAGGRTRVEIDQTQSRAILSWDSFNVGRETDLVFDQQGNASWAVLNRVTDASADPSRILGSIRADGTVMILNRNGIIFSGSAQVNARNIVAAAADLSRDQFLTRGIYSTQEFGQYRPSFTNAGGPVTVDAGARLTTNTPTSVLDGGGYVLLIGTQVTNAGTIATARGQTLLAAGDNFLVRPGVGTEANQYSTTRGNEVRALTNEDSTSGAVSNTGQIEATRGDITLTGRTILQDGILLATTSVSQRGTVHLSTARSDPQGSVTLTPNSLTTILPELDSNDTALNSQRDALVAESAKQDFARLTAAEAGRDGLTQFDNLSRDSDRRDQSRVEIVSGGDVLFDSGSMTVAQGGQVSVSAAGRVQTNDGASIDVSGVRDVLLDPNTNIVRVNVQGNELRDSPTNREEDGLKNQNVWVDMRDLIYVPDGTGGYEGDRYYTSGGLLEVGGVVGNQAHGIGEWAAVGGRIALSGSEVAAAQGSVFDISGGSLSYSAGSVLSTRVQGADGRLYDINDAPLGMRFVSVGRSQTVEHPRWGAQFDEVYSNALFNRGTYTRHQDAYVVGRDAGQLVISAPTVLFEGDIAADVVQGPRQGQARPDGNVDGYKLGQDMIALAGRLLIGRYGPLGANQAFDNIAVIDDIPDITGDGLGSDALPDDRIGTVLLDASRLDGFGLGGLSITAGRGISIDSALTLADGGTLTLISGDTVINADVTIRSGNVIASNFAPASGVGQPVPLVLDREDGVARFTLGEGATIDLAGVWTNGLLDRSVSASVAHVDGGSLSARLVRGSIVMSADSVVDVSSGATLTGDGDLIGGRGGDVSLIAGAALVETNAEAIPTEARLVLDGTILAQGVIGGGTLTIRSPQPLTFGIDEVLASGVLEAGVALPTDVALTEETTIPAGTRLTARLETQLRVALPDIELPRVAPLLDGPLVTAGPWTIPDGVNVIANGSFVPPGTVLPAGSVINSFNGSLPPGTILPSSVFPNGVPIFPYSVSYAAGETTPFPLTLRAGQVIYRGSTFDQQVRFVPAFDPGFAPSGFSDYRITSIYGLEVIEGSELRAQVPVLRARADSYSQASGARLADVFESWTPPLHVEDPVTGQLHQRDGASLELRGLTVGIAAGTRLEVDPGERIRIAAPGQIIVNGALVAPGGDISIISEPVGGSTGATAGTGFSIWIGESAVLDAAGRSYGAVDRFGRRYGIAQDGGSIRIGLENYARVEKDLLNASWLPVVIREGAQLDASGAALMIDIDRGNGLGRALTPVDLAGDGGLIQIGSLTGIFNDGTMRAAAGGEAAAGGRLNLVLENSVGTGIGVRTFTVSQDRVGTGLTDDLTPGVSGLPLGQARLSVEEIEAGGFGTLDLWSRDVIAFEGDVDLSMRESLILRRGVLSLVGETLEARVSLSAPYIQLDGKTPEIGRESPPFPSAGLISQFGTYLSLVPSMRNEGRLSLDADLIDMRGGVFLGAAGFLGVPVPGDEFNYRQIPVDVAGFGDVRVTSRGDMRFTEAVFGSGGDVILTAAQLYPTTGTTSSITVGATQDQRVYDEDSSLTIRGYGTTPAMPLSAFGSLRLTAPTVDQGGIIRAPLGQIVLGTIPSAFPLRPNSLFNVVLREGSITSVSAAGLLLPYGGTADGLTYLYNGVEVAFLDPADLARAENFVDQIERGVLIGHAQLTAEEGSLLDVSGGGELMGAGFFTGRGGSVDVLRTALANANPAYGFNGADAEVYAIVPAHQGDYAPVTPDAGSGAPRVGQQITLTEAAGDLPAGTYTLMPATFALLPGAYRIELGPHTPLTVDARRIPDGSVQATGYLGIANTGVRDALPTAVTLTSSKAVRTFSQYNETSYAQFAVQRAATFGERRPRLERDASNIHLDFGGEGLAMTFEGVANMAGVESGLSGNLFLTAANDLEVIATGAETTEGMTAVRAEDISAFDAGTVTVGGFFSLVQAISAPNLGSQPLGPRVVFTGLGRDVVIREGAVLAGGQIFVVGQDIVVEGGATLDSTGGPANGLTSSAGYIFSETYNDRDANGGAVLTVANGFVNFNAPIQDEAREPNSIVIEDGAILRTLGTINLTTNGQLTLGEAELNARYLTLTTPSLNVGTAESFAAAEAAGVLGEGVQLSQSVLERLLRPTSPGQVPIERLSFTVGQSINFFGTVDLNMRSVGGESSALLVLNTPAIYGWGEAGDQARIITDTLIWGGLVRGAGTDSLPFVSIAPGAVTPDGAGTGAGTFIVDARRIEFGYEPGARSQDQVALDRLLLGFAAVDLRASERVTANNYGTLAVYQTGTDAASYAGGRLNILTPLMTGEAGASMAYRTGGAITVSAAAAAADTSIIGALGAEVRLAGQSVTIDTAVALPSGRLVVAGREDVTLTDRAQIDLSGRAVQFFDQTRYSWGGDLLLEAGSGTLRQAAGSVIDVSAEQADAGSIRFTAMGAAGGAELAGSFVGTATDGFVSGSFDVRAHDLGDFAELNRRLTSGGFFEERSFVIGAGDLVVGNEVRARRVTISADGGSLTVNGRIDAGGEDVGTIRLAARDDLILAGTALLDVHGTRLVADSYGQAIHASNSGDVELTSAEGIVRLLSGATIDLSSADAVARGRLEINAPRVGGDDVAVDAATGINIRGAESVAVNAFATYVPADGTVNQAYLDQIHADSSAFIDAAGTNPAVALRLAGLTTLGSAFHLRPGVEIRSATTDGDVRVVGDLDFAGYRYGPGVDPALYGSGEPGVVVFRAGGDLIINGSINDGFAPPPVTPDDGGWFTRVVLPGNQEITEEITFNASFDFTFFDYYYAFPGALTGVDLPVVVSGSITDGFGSFYGPGDQIPGLLYGTITIAAGTRLQTEDPANSTIIAGVPREARSWWASPMLAPGTQSWSMRLVGGANLASADNRTVRARSSVGDHGDVVLDAPGAVGPYQEAKGLAVVRTGTGTIDVLAGGDYRQESMFGVYTAGTQIADSTPWDEARGLGADGTVLGIGKEAYEATFNARRMYFTEGGGDVRIAAQGDVRGYAYGSGTTGTTTNDIGRWLWRQGGSGPDQLTAWGVNFGQYWYDGSGLLGLGAYDVFGFAGIGTLGGGDLTVIAGGDAGSSVTVDTNLAPLFFTDTSLNLAVAGSGRVTADGRLIQTGGGTLRLDVGGRMNSGLFPYTGLAMTSHVMNLRGDTRVSAGSIGQTLERGYGLNPTNDPRAIDTSVPRDRLGFGHLVIATGDGNVSIESRGDLIVATALDPGRLYLQGGSTAVEGSTDQGFTSFTLWTERSGIALFAGGGDILQRPMTAFENFGVDYDPGRFTAIAASGSITTDLGLAPSATGILELLASNNLYGTSVMSSGPLDALPTPLDPHWVTGAFVNFQFQTSGTNAYDSGGLYSNFFGGALFAFTPDQPTNLYAGTTDPIRMYAVNGDIVASTGYIEQVSTGATLEFNFYAARPVHMRAGRDILASGLILNNDPDDISIVRAGRDILNTTLRVAGPGLLEVTAGRNIYQALGGSDGRVDLIDSAINSIGPIVNGDTRSGAGIVLTAGLGDETPDYAAFGRLYLDSANQADLERPLADQPGKVIRTYDRELVSWLEERFGYAGSADGALAYFQALPEAQQGVFLRGIYFEELRQSGREYTDPESRRFNSYLRGRNAVSVFLPRASTDDQPSGYSGSITLIEGAGVHTDFGGTIQVLAPGGPLTLGAAGVAPPVSTGLLTQGAGDIETYTQDSILLGLSRVFTTFGGDITMWSARGDINAGRGAKGTIVYAPVRRVYDDIGNVALSPTVPTSGAGIGTLDPIPEVPAGDIDLIAPLGTVDAGEAGIRVSGDLNIAALRVVNAANIDVQGEATGLPVVAAVNTSALTAASAATSAVLNQAERLAERSRPAPLREMPVILNVRFVGFGEE